MNNATPDEDVALTWLHELTDACSSLLSNYLTLLRSSAPTNGSSSYGSSAHPTSSASDGDNDTTANNDRQSNQLTPQQIIKTYLDDSSASDISILNYISLLQTTQNTPLTPATLPLHSAHLKNETSAKVAAHAQLAGLQMRISGENIVESGEKLLTLIKQLRVSILLSTGGGGGGATALCEQ